MRPRRACEIAPDGVFAARSTAVDAPLEAAVSIPFSSPLAAGLEAPVFSDRPAVLDALTRALDTMDENGRDWTLIVPDACVRVALLDFDVLPARPQEVLPLVRFRLRKMVPFDVDAAGVSYQIVSGASSATKTGPVQVLAAAMAAEVREEFESLMREADREPGVLLPATLAALAAMPDSGSQLLVHTGLGSVTTAITRNGELMLLRRTEYSEADTSEMVQAILVAAAYYEDVLQIPLEEIWAAGLETPEALRAHLEESGEWRIPLRSLVTSEAFTVSAAPGMGASRYTGVVGALRG